MNKVLSKERFERLVKDFPIAARDWRFSHWARLGRSISVRAATDDLDSFLTALSAGQPISTESFAEMTDFGSAGYGLGFLQVRFLSTQTALIADELAAPILTS